MLLIHGDDDRNVPFSETVTLVEALRKQGVEFEELIFPDEVHDFLTHAHWLAGLPCCRGLLRRHLVKTDHESAGLPRDRSDARRLSRCLRARYLAQIRLDPRRTRYRGNLLPPRVPQEEATSRIREGIQHYNRSVGTINSDHSGYHETLTVFWMAIVKARLRDLADRLAARRGRTSAGGRTGAAARLVP